MARQLILQNLMKLARGIGANPGKFMGTKTNISFLGAGPTKNPLFQGPLAGLEGATEAQLGSRNAMIGAVEDAMGYATAQKLNDIQLRALELNLQGLNKIYNPPPLPMATVTPIRGIGSLKSDPKFSEFFGYPKHPSGKRMSTRELIKWRETNPTEYDAWRAAMKRSADESALRRGKLPKQGKVEEVFFDHPRDPRLYKGPDLPEKTYAARAALYKLLDMPATQEGVGVTLRDTMSKKDLKWLLEGGGGAQGDPIAMFTKYYGRSSAKQLPSTATPAVIAKFARQVIKRKDRLGRRIDDPFFNREDLDFAGGGLAHILQVPRSGYAKGRLVKSALAILNRNKKNAEYMFKASDNVSPGYAKGDLKYNAELLADQLAEDAGVIYDDLGSLERTKFYGTAYDYLAKEMGMIRQMQKEVKNMVQLDALNKWDPTGRKPSASGGLAGILEV
jgi:hypothetical protein